MSIEEFKKYIASLGLDYRKLMKAGGGVAVDLIKEAEKKWKSQSPSR